MVMIQRIRSKYTIQMGIYLAHDRVFNSQGPVERNSGRGALYDLFVKDAFLVFRALCKLTMKALNTER